MGSQAAETSSREMDGDVEFIGIVQGKEVGVPEVSKSSYFESSNTNRKSKLSLSLKRKRSIVSSSQGGKKRSVESAGAHEVDSSKSSFAVDGETPGSSVPSSQVSTTTPDCETELVTRPSSKLATPPTEHSASEEEFNNTVSPIHSSSAEVTSCGESVLELEASQQNHCRVFTNGQDFRGYTTQSSAGDSGCCALPALVHDSGLPSTSSTPSLDPPPALGGDPLSTTGVTTQEETDPETLDRKEEKYRIPYYLENFLLIVDTIINDDFFEDLFDDEDRRTVKAFSTLSGVFWGVSILCYYSVVHLFYFVRIPELCV